MTPENTGITAAGTIKMGIHVGNALRYVTDNYPTLMKVILELVQNALDSDANRIRVNVNYKTRSLSVNDNGTGISPEKFQEAISSVCGSLKKNAGKLGQFGIGMMSPLGKCKGFLITSAEKSAMHSYNRWVFDSQKILSSRDLVAIPIAPLPDYCYAKTGRINGPKTAVDWRTEVFINEFSNDKSVNAITLAELKNLILGQFSEAMKKLDAEIFVSIKTDKTNVNESFKAADFKGEKLGLVVYDEKSSKTKTKFDIYLSPKLKTGRKGQILFGIEGNDFRIPAAIFVKSTPEIDAETARVILSGSFEGSIISGGCTMHPNRKEFCDNEARLELLINLEMWVKNHGLRHLSLIKDEEKDVWFQNVGSLAIYGLEEKLKNELPHLLAVVKSFRVGTVGPGHYGFYKSKVEQDFSSSHLRGKSTKHEAKPQESDKLPGKPVLHPGHTPFKVGGEGTQRRLVKGHSTGMQFVYEEMPGNDNHWEFDSEIGVLTFNTRSNIWARMEDSERNLILYQQYVAIKALELQLVPPNAREAVFEFLQKELESAVIFIAGTSLLHPRKAKSEVGQKY